MEKQDYILGDGVEQDWTAKKCLQEQTEASGNTILPPLYIQYHLPWVILMLERSTWRRNACPK